MSQESIDRYEAGPEKLSLALRGLTEQDLRWLPPADGPADLGRWSIQQVTVHLLDSELVSTDRLKRMIAHDNPPLLGYDEVRYAQRLFYNEQSATAAAQIIELNRRNFARVLRHLDAAALRRTGQHNERGELTVGGYIQSCVEHLEHHVRFIHSKRKFMGKEMW